ncbi:MAG: hypothetical protein SVU69_13465 [Pseudomonadota bacterium]|nr:hypothetical protein [Pseudomonadota bacterium]
MNQENVSIDMNMDANALYLEETFSDRRVGTIRRLSPVTPDGAADSTRAVIYLGHAQVMTPVGALPLSFEIEASSLSEAAQKFGAAAEVAVEQAARELQELRREAASSIVVPGAGGDAMGGGGGMGGGKIQLR